MVDPESHGSRSAVWADAAFILPADNRFRCASASTALAMVASSL